MGRGNLKPRPHMREMNRASSMQMTLSIADDVLVVARGLSEHDNVTGGAMISDLASRALHVPDDRLTGKTRNGFPLLPVRKGSLPVTTELVNRLRDEFE
jgi:hypothetical protein